VDLAGNSNSTETRLIKGNVAPEIVSVEFSPNYTDLNAIDPNVLVNVSVNISDEIGNLDYAFLQWKNQSLNWSEANNETNISFEQNGDYLYFNFSFNLPDYEKNISVRIWAIDEENDIGLSEEFIFESFWDCTWSVSPLELEEVVGFYEDKFVGNITLINTGDEGYGNNNCSLSFTIGSIGSGWSETYQNLAFGDVGNWPSGNRFFQLTTPAIVNASTNKTISINASFPSVNSPLVETPKITLSSSINDSITNQKTEEVLTTLLILPEGPYLFQRITNYPVSVRLEEGSFSIDSYFRNIAGDEGNINSTAYNVSFDWEIPSDLESYLDSNSSERLEIFFGNITNNSQINTSLIFEFPSNILDLFPSSLVGVDLNFTKSVYGYSNLTGELELINHTQDGNTTNVINETIQIAFNYPAGWTPPAQVITTPGTGGGGGGGGGPSAVYESSEAEYYLVRGKEQEFEIELENKYSSVIEKIKVSVSGISSDLIEISPNEIPLLQGKEKIKINVRTMSPAYFTEGVYRLTFNFAGTLVTNTSRNVWSEKRLIDLYIVDVSLEDVNFMFEDYLRMLEEMQNSNFSTMFFERNFKKMNLSYSERVFSQVKLEYELLKKIYESSFEARDMINELYELIADAERKGINVFETKRALYTAEIIFKRGEYLIALEKLKEAKLTYALETKGEFSLYHTVKNNPLESFGIFFLAFVFSVSSTLTIKYKLYKRKLKLLLEEETLLLELMKVVQREVFEKNRMSMEEYRVAMQQYEARLSEAIEEKISIETKLAHMFKIKGKSKALVEEKKKLIEQLRGVQEAYLNEGKMETRIYDNLIKTYSSRLAEIEEQMTFLEAQEALGEGKWWKKVSRVVGIRR
jgi:hypothetical protein